MSRGNGETKTKRNAAEHNSSQQARGRRKAFLEALRRTGSILGACRAAGVARTAVYRWQSKSRAFNEAVKAARAEAVARLEQRAIEVAESGWTEVTEVTDPDGRVTTTTRERYSPAHTVRVLESLSARRWTRQLRHQHSGQVAITTPALQARLLADPDALEAACDLAARLTAPEAPGEPPGRWVEPSPSPETPALPGPSTAAEGSPTA